MLVPAFHANNISLRVSSRSLLCLLVCKQLTYKNMPLIRLPKVKLLEVALCLLLMFTGISMLVSIQLFLCIPLTVCVGLCAGLLLPLLFVWKREMDIRSYAVAFGIFLICTLAAGLLYDFSWDGQAYHQLAQIMLARGWNPYWSPETVGVYINDVWVNAYPKSLWIYSSSIYALTGNILMGKGYYLYLAIATFILCYKVFLLNFPGRRSLSTILALLLTFNPVVCCQMLTYYIDATIYLLIVNFLAINYLLIKGKLKQRFMASLVVFGIVVVTCNTKFTGVVYMMVFCVTELAMLVVLKNKAAFRHLFSVYLFAGVFGVCFIGYNPYITNIVRHGNVGWPIMGHGKKDIIGTQINPEFAEKSRFAKFFISYNSRSVNSKTEEPRLKLPGSVKVSELKVMVGADARFGGFGPWFNIGLLLSAIGILFLAVRRSFTPLRVMFLVGLLASVFVNPECWWARYVPQLYILPVVVAAWGMKDANVRVRKSFALLPIVLAVNLCLVVCGQPYIYLKEMYGQVKLNLELKEAYKKSRKPMYVDFDHFYSRTASIMEWNHIPYVYFNSKKYSAPNGYKKLFCDDNRFWVFKGFVKK